MLLTKLFENNFKLLLPEFFLATCILILILFGSSSFLYREINFPLISYSIIWLCFLILFGTSFLIFFSREISSVIFNGLFICDFLSQNIKFLVVFGSSFCLLTSFPYIKKSNTNFFEFYLLFLLAIFGCLLLCSCFDILGVYLAIELQSLCFYILTSFKRKSLYSSEAGLKYFFLGIFSSSLLLFGFSILYGFCGLTNFESLYVFFFLEQEKNSIIQIIIVFLSCSLFFKVGCAPFHLWLPDIYEGAPQNVTIFFALIPKLTFFLIFLRILFFFFGMLFYSWQFLILFCCFFSIFVGSFLALKQQKIKRLLSFSSISSTGYVFLGFLSFTFEGLQAAFFYIFGYFLMSVGIWSIFCCLNFFSVLDRPKTISDFLYFKSNFVLSFSACVFLFSIAGIPPLLGFFLKFSVFLSIVNLSFFLFCILLVLINVISTFYYIRLIKIMVFEKFSNNLFLRPVSKEISILLSFCSFLLFFLFVNPNFLWLLCYEMTFCIFF